MGDFKKWGDPSNEGVILKWGVGTPLRTMRRNKDFKKEGSKLHQGVRGGWAGTPLQTMIFFMIEKVALLILTDIDQYI